MHKVEIKKVDGRPDIIDVSDFDNLTNKRKPYFYSASQRYALCPTCGSIVNIVGGKGSSLQSTRNKNAYASHLGSIPPIVNVQGLAFNSNYTSCPAYQGNNNNWQGLYKNNRTQTINQKLQSYINNHSQEIAKEMSELTGVIFYNRTSTNRLYSDVLDSFINNKGLYTNSFYPDFVSRQILEVASPVDFWGYIITNATALSTVTKSVIGKDLVDSQLKSSNVQFVVDIDNINSPKNLLVKLLYPNGELVISKATANPL
ncbi:hypothetical protein [Lactococcus raffinolactis]|uniref:hypothetical protein n=1 Tax=Pseudolactococcus raffinolactis TaxID=1366 RepID=UPI0039AF8700